MEYRASRGLPTEFGALGFLLEGPAHGYDLQQRMRAGLGPLWRVAWSQLYKVLHGLEDRGWVRAVPSDSPSGPPRTTYSITPAGRDAFFRWAADPVPRLRDLRIELLVKLFFLRTYRPEGLDALLDRQVAALRAADPGRRQGGDPWLAGVAAEFRLRQTESAIAWIGDLRKRLARERKESETT